MEDKNTFIFIQEFLFCLQYDITIPIKIYFFQLSIGFKISISLSLVYLYNIL
jgi:hypothetical protein